MSNKRKIERNIAKKEKNLNNVINQIEKGDKFFDDLGKLVYREDLSASEKVELAKKLLEDTKETLNE